MPYKLIIAGSRDFDDYELLKNSAIDFLDDHDEVEIVSGTARGADQLGERLAEDFGFSVKQFPAKWRPYGVFDKAAGYKRNIDMAEYAHALIAFWDGKSKGTKHMIYEAKKRGLQVRVVKYAKT